MKTVTATTLTIASSAFEQGSMIPVKYTCDGKNVNPPLQIKGTPSDTKSLALIVDDPDAPIGTWDHWIVWNIKPTEEIKENSVPGTEGINSFRKLHYGGPCPPSGTHRYFFKVYALDKMLDLKPGVGKHELLKAMESHTIAYGELIGKYKRE